MDSTKDGSGPSPQGRRRRRVVVAATNGRSESPILATDNDSGDYFEDSGDEKDRRSRDEKMYGSACSLGRFCLNPCLCVVTSCQYCWRQNNCRRKMTLPLAKQKSKRSHKYKSQREQIIDAGRTVGAILLGLACVYTFFPDLLRGRRFRFHHLRPVTDAEVNQLEIVIPRLDFHRGRPDIGGWMFPHRIYKTYVTLETSSKPDYGSLIGLPNGGGPRENRLKDDEAYALYRDNVILGKGKEISVSDWHNEEVQDRGYVCERVDWKLLYSPTCNDIHEIDITADYKEEDDEILGNDQVLDTFYISNGYYRDVWVVSQPALAEKSVLKKARYKFEHNIGTFHSSLRDALIMERLTGSPRIVDIFGHCGTSIVVEAIPFEVEEYIVPGDGYSKKEDLHDEDEVQPRNDYNTTDKLEMALTMAESLADLHGFPDGVIVHDDVQLCQWLRMSDNRLKLGDFNRAEIMDYDPVDQEYCKYGNGAGFGNYRAPEEFAKKLLDEKIDVFTFGNNIYALLTGLWVFYENEDDGVVQKKLIAGELAYVDPRYKERSFAEAKMVEIMEKCWEYDPEKRIDIFEVVKLLREAVAENKKRESAAQAKK